MTTSNRVRKAARFSMADFRLAQRAYSLLGLPIGGVEFRADGTIVFFAPRADVDAEQRRREAAEADAAFEAFAATIKARKERQFPIMDSKVAAELARTTFGTPKSRRK